VLAEAFRLYAVPAVIGIGLFLLLVLATLPFFRGSVRVFLDRTLPPWSIYRMIHGATFLRNVAVQTKAGIQVYNSVSGMTEGASPWLRERLEAALQGIRQGFNLGDALHYAEHDFPDHTAVKLLRVFARRNNFEDKIYLFAKEWQQTTLAMVKKASSVLFMVAILTLGVVAGVTLTGIQALSSMIEEQADAVSSGAASR